jgi:hypothetical protein
MKNSVRKKVAGRKYGLLLFDSEDYGFPQVIKNKCPKGVDIVRKL